MENEHIEPTQDAAPEASSIVESAEPKSLEATVKDVFEGVDWDDESDVEAKAAEALGEEKPSSRERDASGRFKAKGASQGEESDETSPKNETETVDVAPVNPPSGVNPEAWAAADPALRADVSRRFQEMESGLAQYQAVFQPLKPYMEAARAQGQEFHQVVEGWRHYEGWMQQDPVQGVQYMLQALGRDPEEFALDLLDAIGEPGAAAAHRPSPQVAQLQQQVQQLQQYIAQQERTTHEQRISAEIDAFQANAPRFAELEDTIAGLLQSPMVPANLPPADRLARAYEMADRLTPAAPSQPQQAAPQAPLQPHTPRAANKSVSGAPAGGSNPSSRRAAKSPQDAVAQAMAEIGWN